MKHKGEVLGCFKAFYAYVKNQFGASIQTIRSDNGTEYVNKEFQSFLQEKGFYTRHHALIPHHKMEWLKGRIGIFWR
jgi:transposase InsO family protein